MSCFLICYQTPIYVSCVIPFFSYFFMLSFIDGALLEGVGFDKAIGVSSYIWCCFRFPSFFPSSCEHVLQYLTGIITHFLLVVAHSSQTIFRHFQQVCLNLSIIL